MPLMGGVELIRRIREVKPQARVVLLSGFVEPLGLTEENTGADAVIAKNNQRAHEPGALRQASDQSPARAQAAGSRSPAWSLARAA